MDDPKGTGHPPSGPPSGPPLSELAQQVRAVQASGLLDRGPAPVSTTEPAFAWFTPAQEV